MRFISVDLPEPEGPMIATYSPCWIWMRDAAQRVDLLGAHRVGLPEVPGLDQSHGQAVSEPQPTRGSISSQTSERPGWFLTGTAGLHTVT